MEPEARIARTLAQTMPFCICRSLRRGIASIAAGSFYTFFCLAGSRARRRDRLIADIDQTGGRMCSIKMPRWDKYRLSDYAPPRGQSWPRTTRSTAAIVASAHLRPHAQVGDR